MPWRHGKILGTNPLAWLAGFFASTRWGYAWRLHFVPHIGAPDAAPPSALRYDEGMATATCAEFLESFVLPLVAGGALHVGKPIDAATLETFQQQLPHASVPLVAIDEARERVLSRIVVRPPACVLDEDELHLAAAVHNLLFLAHPDADGWNMSESGRAKVVTCSQSFAARPRSIR